MTSPRTFQVKPQVVTALQFDGHNRKDIEVFIGPHGVTHDNTDGTMTIYSEGREGRQIRPAWWVTVTEDGIVTTWPPWVFDRIFAPF
jgi:hypothetical protein